jgi:hypothetical protein
MKAHKYIYIYIEQEEMAEQESSNSVSKQSGYLNEQ